MIVPFINRFEAQEAHSNLGTKVIEMQKNIPSIRVLLFLLLAIICLHRGYLDGCEVCEEPNVARRILSPFFSLFHFGATTLWFLFNRQ